MKLALKIFAVHLKLHDIVTEYKFTFNIIRDSELHRDRFISVLPIVTNMKP